MINATIGCSHDKCYHWVQCHHRTHGVYSDTAVDLRRASNLYELYAQQQEPLEINHGSNPTTNPRPRGFLIVSMILIFGGFPLLLLRTHSYLLKAKLGETRGTGKGPRG